MPVNAPGDDPGETQRFRDAALPYLDDVYTVARYLLRDASDAEDAVQECYLRALRHFGSYRGPAIKPWLLAILRNVCHAEFARRTRSPTTDSAENARIEPNEDASAWHDVQESPEATLLRHRNATAIRRLVDALPEPFRETIVLREIENLSYRAIAEIIDAPIGTVMSRLARARAMLRVAWMAEEEPKE